jgi:hypothetical protein
MRLSIRIGGSPKLPSPLVLNLAVLSLWLRCAIILVWQCTVVHAATASAAKNKLFFFIALYVFENIYILKKLVRDAGKTRKLIHELSPSQLPTVTI